MKLSIEQAAVDALVAWAEATLAGDPRRAELVTRIRSLALVPISRLYGRFPKMIDDLAETLGKQVNPIVLDGAEIALAPRAFNEVANALVHLLRNAVDHGIEAPEVRLKGGKPAQGTIALRAFHEGDRLRMDVVDDGGGIDAAKLVAIARQRGVLAADEHPVGAAALELIFRPGFSTAARTTDVSGRGVGMDAVKALIEGLGGGVEIETRLGKGTTFHLWIPRATALGE
jgi:two-component system chemotaxis sensor kinase CheA